jgi:hypothetical protein
VLVFWFHFRYILNSNTSLSMSLFCNSRIHAITLYSGHVRVYYASMLRCWHLIWILVRTDHPCIGVGCHSRNARCPSLTDKAPTAHRRWPPPTARASPATPSYPLTHVLPSAPLPLGMHTPPHERLCVASRLDTHLRTSSSAPRLLHATTGHSPPPAPLQHATEH